MIQKVFSVNNSTYATDIALLIARLGFGILMLTHGIPKLMMLFSGEPIMFPSVMGLSPTLSLTMAVFAEVVCSILLITGMATRLAAIPLAFTMLVAAFFIHAPDPLQVKELALLYLVVFIVIILAGPGKISVDHIISSKLNKY